MLTATNCAGVVTWSTGQVGVSSISVKPTVTTQYNAICTLFPGDGSSCQSTAASILIRTQPAAPVVHLAGSAQTVVGICPGGSVSLVAEGCPPALNWYRQAASGGLDILGTVDPGASFIVTPSSSTTYVARCHGYGPGCSDSPNSQPIIVSVTSTNSFALSSRVAGVSTTQSLTLTASGCSTGSTVFWNGPNSTTATGSIWTITSFTQTSTYTARCETTGGCSSSTSVTVPYSLPRSPTIRTSATQICSGQSLTLTANGCQTGTTVLWSGGQTGEVLILTPAVTATYKASCILGEVMSDPSTQLGITVLSSHTVTTSGSQTYAVGQTISLSAVSSATGAINYRWSGPNNFTSTAQNPTIPTATTAMSGTYTVVATNAGGCTATAQTSVSLGAAASATISGNLTLCAGQSTTLTASGGTGYLWSTGEQSASVVINPTTSSIYSVTVTIPDGATSVADASVTVSAMSSLTVSGKATLCAGESTTLIVSGGNDYLWSTGELGDRVVVSPTVSTTYTVWAIGDNGCASIADVIVSPTSFSVTASSRAGGANSANQAPSAQAPSATYGQTFTLSATVDGSQSEPVVYAWSGPNSFTSNQQFPSFLYTSAAQLGTYEVVASTAQGCVSGARVGFGTEPECALGISVQNKTNSFNVTTNEHWLTAAGCPSGSSLSWSNGTTGRVGPDGKITWADGETGQLAGGLVGDRVVVVNPQRTTTYIAICALPSSKTCTSSVEIRVSSSDCANLQIAASATTYEQGDVITLTAANCTGTLTWSNGLGSASSIKIAPTADLIVSAECTDGTKTCYSNAIAIRNQSCLKSLYTNSILTRADGKKQVQFGYQGCETGSVTWSIVSGSWSSTVVQKQSEALAGLYTVVGVTGNLTVSANCTRPGGATCTAATLTVNENALNTCKGYFIGVGTSVGAPPNTVTIDGSTRAFTLADETNFAFNTTPQKQVYVPVSAKEKLYTATFDNGCKSSVKVFPTSIRVRLTWTEKGAGSATGGYAGGTLETQGKEKDAFVLNTYFGYTYDGYEVNMALQGYCPGTGVLTSSTSPYPGNSLPINQLVLRKSSYFTTPRPVQYQPFPTATTDYYGSCQVSGTDGSVITYPAITTKRLVVISTSCIQITANKSVLTKGESVQLNAKGCIGTVNWSLAGTNLGLGATLTHTPLPATTPSSMTYVAACSNPACSQTAVVTVNACSFLLTAAKTKVAIAEAVVLSSSGCSGGIVQWGTGETGSGITVKPLENTTYTATCLVGGASVCQSTVALTVENTPPDDIACPAFVLTSNTQTIVRCSQQPVLITPSGCPVGSTIRWSDGTIGGPTAPHTYTLSDAVTITATCTTPYQISVTQALSISATAPKLEISPTEVYAGFPAMLRASGCFTSTCQPGQYTWSVNGTVVGSGSSLKVTLAQATTYVVSCSNGSSKPMAVSLTQTCEVEYKTAAGIDGKSYLSIPDGCNVGYGVTWYKDNYTNGTSSIVATNVKKITVGLPACDQYGTGGDYYHVICVKENKVPCETRFSVFCDRGAYPVIPVSASDPTTPDPCNDLAYIAKGGVKNIARSPGDESTGNYYVLYTDWCPGTVVWYDGNRKLTQLTVGPFSSVKSFNYECTLGNGQVCKSSYSLPSAAQQSGGRLASRGAVSSGVSDNCSSQISLATASAVFYGQLLCQVSNLIQSREDAIAVLSSLQTQLSGTGLVFPTDQTAIIDALVAGECGQAGALLAGANGNALIDNAVFNAQINAIFGQVQQQVLAAIFQYKGRFIVYTRHFIPESRDGFYAYRGDGRGFSATPNESEYDDNNWETNSSRVIIKNVVEFDTRLINIPTPYCDPTILLGIINQSAVPSLSKKDYKYLSESLANFDMSYTASDPLALGLAPVLNYDLKVQVELIPSLQTLKVSAILAGDPYPAGEIFILDKKTGQSWFIDTYSIPGQLEVTSSYPENHLPLINAIRYFKVNSSGIITSVLQDGGPVSINIWNNGFKNRNTRK